MVEHFYDKFGDANCGGFFEISCGKTDIQTNRQTDSAEIRTHTATTVGVGY